MPRNMTITTHWSARGSAVCNTNRTCPGVHSLADRPDVLYIVGREIASLGTSRVLCEVPEAIHASGRVVTTRVTDPEELAAFADEIGPGEVLGTVPLHEWDGAVPVEV
jgi:hypothetical protein